MGRGRGSWIVGIAVAAHLPTFNPFEIDEILAYFTGTLNVFVRYILGGFLAGRMERKVTREVRDAFKTRTGVSK